MAYNEQLAARIRAFFNEKNIATEEKRMMGGLGFMVEDKMCVGVESDRLMARLDPEVYEASLKRKGCQPMDFTGRPMKGFVFVAQDGIRSKRDLAHWLNLALEFNPKAKSSKKKKPRKTAS